jgi:hypothetical protein
MDFRIHWPPRRSEICPGLSLDPAKGSAAWREPGVTPQNSRWYDFLGSRAVELPVLAQLPILDMTNRGAVVDDRGTTP